MLLLLVMPATTTAVALGPLGRSVASGAASALVSGSSAVHHMLEPRAATSATLDQLVNVRIKGRDTELLAHCAVPSEPPPGPLPILILLHEFFGLSESIVAKAQLLADDCNCLVIAPDTFRGDQTSFIPKAIFLALTTPQDRVNRDLDDVLAWAASSELGRVAGVVADAKRVAIMGFCLGGGQALRYTTQARPSAATVVWYGNPLYNPDDLAGLRAPVCGIFGVNDPQIPQPLVNKFREALEEADIEHEIVSYDGVGHAFWKNVGQVEKEEVPIINGYRLTTTFLNNYYSGAESFARKRAFLEFMLEENEDGGGGGSVEGGKAEEE